MPTNSSYGVGRSRIVKICRLLLPLLALGALAVSNAALGLTIAPLPAEVSSEHFVISVDGQKSPVMHAAGTYYLLNFDLDAPAQITVTASDPHYWDAGVEVQPVRYGIRPRREGASITFLLLGPTKLSITRPGDHFGDSEMLFLFANAPEPTLTSSSTPNTRYYGPGIHRENIDAKSGDSIYLAAGAVVFGSLNIWQVHDVRVYGEGTIVYDGPQNPKDDDGWMHKPNWHAIVMDEARNITIEGITAVVRSRTWMVQMKDSRGIVFRNVKVLGNCPGNANQDGIDWLGGGDTLVQDSFFRASDDIFAMYGNWDGYSKEALTAPGHEVSNIVIEKSVLSTSISNIVRVGWPNKVFDSHHFTLRDSDVIHMGMGGCGVPFALLAMWADPGGKGEHVDYRFEDIRLEDWYSLTQLHQPDPKIRDVAFRRVWALDGPGMVASALKGDVDGVSFHSVDLGDGQVKNRSDLPLDISAGAAVPQFDEAGSGIGLKYKAGVLRPGTNVTFTATGNAGLHYRWLFGDGTMAEGRRVHHAFPDAQGTMLDGSGRFRVLLEATDADGKEAWSSQTLVVGNQPHVQIRKSAAARGLAVDVASKNRRDGFVRIPADGGYTFTMLTSTSASLTIDGVTTHGPMLRPQVCGSPGNAVQPVRVSGVFKRGLHQIAIVSGDEPENAAHAGTAPGQPVLLWQGPGLLPQIVPAAALSH